MEGASYPEDDYFLLEGMPIGKSMEMRDFFKNSNYTSDDFAIGDYGYELIKQCLQPQKNLLFYISAEGGWIKKEVGHYIVKSHLNSDNTHTIDMVIIEPYDD